MNCHPILADRLWVGSYLLPDDVERLEELGITTVISLQSDEDLFNYRIPLEQVREACELASIRLLRIPIRDFDPKALAARLPLCVEELERELAPPGNRVYLHCTAGINRAPTAAAALLMKMLGLSARAAFNHLNLRRPCSPYLEVLEEFALSLGDRPAL